MQGKGYEYGDGFGEVPQGLPSSRNIGHMTFLEPWSIPPFCPLFHLIPLELYD